MLDVARNMGRNMGRWELCLMLDVASNIDRNMAQHVDVCMLVATCSPQAHNMITTCSQHR
jgi:hypothetical protein